MPRIKKDFLDRFVPEPNSGCWLWLEAVDKDGYGDYVESHIRLASGKYVRKRKKAHRASWEIHRGPIPRGLDICHKCDVTGCVNPDHLFLGTPKQNTADMIAKGRVSRGSHRPNAKLTDETVREIRSSPATQRALALKYGVTFQTINDVCLHKTWAHVSL